MPLAAMWRLTLAWYGDRLDRDWRPASVEHLQGLLTAADLTGDFWRLR